MLDRPKRAKAGNRMEKLIEEQVEDEDDEFYKTTYGGFQEDDDDEDYQSEEMEEDIVDSDFSLSEQEDEVEGDGEDEAPKRRKRKKKFYGKKPSDGAPKPKKPRVKKEIVPVQPVDKGSRMRATTLLKGEQLAKKQSTQSNVIKRHPTIPQMRRLTQKELLAEAEITEEQNTASLAQFLKLEEEKKNTKVTKVRFQGPVIRFQSVRMPDIDIEGEEKETFCCRNFLEFTDAKNYPKHYFPNPRVKYPEKQTCIVTGCPAKYKDPVTGLPYATIEAFKYIRQHRQRLKEKMTKVKSENRRGRKTSLL